MKRGITLALLSALALAIAVAFATNAVARKGSQEVIPFKEAKIIIEHNATDGDTGFQGFVDSDGWRSLDIEGPDGAVLSLKARGDLAELGMTELFFETVEPANAEVSLEEVLATLPEGEYTVSGKASEAGEDMGVTSGKALLTHVMPAGPELLTPSEGDTVPTTGVVMSWSQVTETVDGGEVKIIAYQLIVEEDAEPEPRMIGRLGLSLYLPPEVTSVTLPPEFLKPGTSYVWEVLAIEESGNQTLASSSFATE